MNDKSYVLAAVSAVLLAGGLYYYLIGDNALPEGGNIDGTAQVINIDGGVAIVNGEVITEEEYTSRLAREEAIITAKGGDFVAQQETLNKLLLETLINEALLLQEAKKQQITTTQEEIAEIILQSRAQFETEEDFQAALDADFLTLEEFNNLIFTQETIQRLLEVNITPDTVIASEEEIQVYYAQSIEGSEVYPRLEEVRKQIENAVISEKQQARAIKYINDLHDASAIEIGN